ncbi:hypothetical protein [Nocardia tengchongensis]|uniref:hypothetical protein n=1 Tax=Nocardia tengchongensis TaxID=2055889 RepID=UPI0036ADD039
MPHANPTHEAAICDVLSAARSSTYIRAAGGDKAKAMELYGWNARVSAAFMLPSHFAEVATRNAVAEALESVYGSNWPWDRTFEESVPAPAGKNYNPRRDLQQTRSKQPTTGKVIAELKFAFWQAMFTARHDVRVWNHQILTLFPHSSGMTASQLRGKIYVDLEAVRKLRNRVAHHEPIFTRNLSSDLKRMLQLVELRSAPTHTWLRAMEEVTVTLSQRPVPNQRQRVTASTTT